MASSSSPRWAYDVFVSFRGEDVRKNFMDHLFSAFRRKGIHAFKDDGHLKRGEEISSELYGAIEQSRFLIVIFSENYASSSWCLRELSKILKCKRENDKYELRTIFYNVKPAVVRNQTGSFEEAIMKHEASNRSEVSEWKEALTLAANLSGWDLQDTTNGYESKFIDTISKEIFYKLCDVPFHVGDNLVGLHARVEKMDLLRFVGSDKVHMIGICGIGGIGKTTVAKAIYNLLYLHFEGCSFCEDVKGIVKQHGLVHLQTKLLGDIMNVEGLRIQCVSEGISIMKRRMGTKKALIVLDDVDHYSQFEALATKLNWFGPGSMIFVTSRDRQLLNAHGVEEIYEVDPLNDDEALELFSMYAFSDKHSNKEFIKLCDRIVQYVSGLPLALKVLGLFLPGKTPEEWESELDKLRRCPNVDIQQVLRLSYDGLDPDQRSIFLDVVCFFKGEKKDYVMKILDGCELSSATNLRVLVDKSLITIHGDRLHMHDLIQEMGRQIVREESEEPGKRSRLWYPTNVCDVLNKDKGTELVKGLALDISSSEINICGKTFTKLNNLRLLILYCKWENESKVSTTSWRLDFLSNELRMLCWHGYPFQRLPSMFCPESLVVLDMSYSRIKQLWSGSKRFKMLKSMKLRHCRNLTKTPDFTEITNIEELILEGCVKLTEVHPSVGILKRLIVLNLKNCRSLRSFPCNIELESLQILILSGCFKVDKLPEVMGTVKTLVELHVDGTSMKQLPSFLISLSNLQVFSIGRRAGIQARWWTSIFRPSSLLHNLHHPPSLALPSLTGLRLLRHLDVSHCNISEVSPNSIEHLSCLEYLDMSGNLFTSLPTSLTQLSRLTKLGLVGCKKLEVLPELPPSIYDLEARNCTSLRELQKQPIMYGSDYKSLDFTNCPKLVENQTVESLLSMFVPQGRIFLSDRLDILLQGSRIPRWFSNQSSGNCVTVELPPGWCYDKFRGCGICVVLAPKVPKSSLRYVDSIAFFVLNFDETLLLSSQRNFLSDFARERILMVGSDLLLLLYFKTHWLWGLAKNYIKVSVPENAHFEVKRCGVRLVCDEDMEEESRLRMIQGLPPPTEDGGAFYPNHNQVTETNEDEPPVKKIRIV